MGTERWGRRSNRLVACLLPWRGSKAVEKHPDSPPRGGADSRQGTTYSKPENRVALLQPKRIRHHSPHGVVTRTSHASGRSPADPRCEMSARHASHHAGTAARHRGVMRPVFRFHVCLSRIRRAALIFSGCGRPTRSQPAGSTPDLTVVLRPPSFSGLGQAASRSWTTESAGP